MKIVLTYLLSNKTKQANAAAPVTERTEKS